MISHTKLSENKARRKKELEKENIKRILRDNEAESIAIILFSEIDLKHDGVIDISELKWFFKKHKDDMDVKIGDSFIEEAFSVIDSDNSNAIDLKKMKAFIKAMFQAQLDKLAYTD
eukprot:CAMPEP_0168334550 /NCGR_PEP_ID=MMETSP0213-20121227/10344_1 /TAXON_ID=151035 /ORGANISM="Euplotes harpa, Strain FSP1.4" /LENGTH=115 /DNA_ID=CAMNT_0008339235 /DNA_START=85 /DNA_END=432 /DNA_ORIENTATION=+